MSAVNLTLVEKVIAHDTMRRRRDALQVALSNLSEIAHKNALPYDSTRTVLDSELAVVNSIIAKVRP